MAKVTLHPMFKDLKGAVGGFVYKTMFNKSVVQEKTDTSGQPRTEAQLEAQEDFKEAAVFGKIVLADPVAKALYTEKAREKGQPVFSLTIADFYHAPQVDEVDLSGYTGRAGDPVKVVASDDFQVMEVTVNVTNDGGQVIESGTAVETPAGSGSWLYTATQNVAVGTTVRIAVTAKDRPGHAGEKQEAKAL